MVGFTEDVYSKVLQSLFLSERDNGNQQNTFKKDYFSSESKTIALTILNVCKYDKYNQLQGILAYVVSLLGVS